MKGILVIITGSLIADITWDQLSCYKYYVNEGAFSLYPPSHPLVNIKFFSPFSRASPQREEPWENESHMWFGQGEKGWTPQSVAAHSFQSHMEHDAMMAFVFLNME